MLTLVLSLQTAVLGIFTMTFIFCYCCSKLNILHQVIETEVSRLSVWGFANLTWSWVCFNVCCICSCQGFKITSFATVLSQHSVFTLEPHCCGFKAPETRCVLWPYTLENLMIMSQRFSVSGSLGRGLQRCFLGPSSPRLAEMGNLEVWNWWHAPSHVGEFLIKFFPGE